MVLGWMPQPPPHAKACVSRNCDTNMCIKFLFDTVIDYLEEGPYRFWQKSGSKIIPKQEAYRPDSSAIYNRLSGHRKFTKS